MKPGNIVITGSSVFRITGIYLGSIRTQDLIGLECITLKDGSAHGKIVKEMLVPREMVELCTVYEEVSE